MAPDNGLQHPVEGEAATCLHVAHRMGDAPQKFRRRRRLVEPAPLPLGFDDGAIVGDKGVAMLPARLERARELKTCLGA